MADGNRLLFEQLTKDKLYTKSYTEFVRQFATPESQAKLYRLMNLDKVYTKTAGDFTKQFFAPIGDRNKDKVPSYKYQSTRGYNSEDRQTLLENMELEKKFEDKYKDKNLWSRYAYINSDEGLKDILNENENEVDPYTLAGLISAEGVIDELHGAATDNGANFKGISGWDTPTNDPDPILNSISGVKWFGTDTFAQRYNEFKKKGITSLEPLPEYDYKNRKYIGKYDVSKSDKYFVGGEIFTNEKGEKVLPADFFTPKAGINAVSSYVKNIENILDESKVKLTPQEKEQLTYIGYNYGENGLKSYLKKGKTGKAVLDIIKKERPSVFDKSMKRVAVANELRESQSLSPLKQK